MKKLFFIVIFFNIPLLFCMEEKNPQIWRASNYEKNAAPQFKAATAILSKISFKGDEKILDIGCGSGGTSIFMADKVPQGEVVGLDASDDMIATAQKRYKDRKNVTFIHADAENYHYDVERFNIVTAFSSLHWIKEQQKVVTQSAQSLKAQGVFLATLAFDSEDNNVRPLIQAMVETGCSEKWNCYTHQTLEKQVDGDKESAIALFLKTQAYPQNEENFSKMLREAELQPIQLKAIERTINFDTKEDFVSWLQGWVGGMPVFASIPEAEQCNFIRDVVDRYITYVPLNEGNHIDYTSHILYVHAQKNN